MKKTKLSDISRKDVVLERIGNSTIAYCERNNVFCEWDISKDDVLTIYVSGYDIAPVADFWKDKINPAFTIQEESHEKDNVFIHVIKLIQE